MALGVNGNVGNGMSDWESKIAKKQSAQLDKIPRDWLLPAAVTKTLKQPLELHRIDVTKIPRSCGIMSQRELSITEDYTVDQLLAAMQASRLTASEVTMAYSKRAAIAGQMVSLVR